MLEAVGMNEINKIFAVIDALGIHREARGDPARHRQGPGAPDAERQARDHRRRRDADRRVAHGLARADQGRPGYVSAPGSPGARLRPPRRRRLLQRQRRPLRHRGRRLLLRTRPLPAPARRHAARLEPARGARHERAGRGAARRGRLRRVGAPRLRSVLGVPGGLVELDQQLRGRRRLSGALRGLPQVLVARACRRSAAGPSCWPSSGSSPRSTSPACAITGVTAVALGVLALAPMARLHGDRGHARAEHAPWRPFAAEAGTA